MTRRQFLFLMLQAIALSVLHAPIIEKPVQENRKVMPVLAFPMIFPFRLGE